MQEADGDKKQETEPDRRGEERRGLLGRRGSGGGLGVMMTAAFLVGDLAGTGILALPNAVESTGWIGLVVLCFCGAFSCYTGELLGECWGIVQERYPDMRGPVRYPFSAMAMIAFGRPGRVAVSVAVAFSLVGGAVVNLLLAAQNVGEVVRESGGPSISLCYWALVLFSVLTPLTLPATPKDFYVIGVGAMVSTSSACLVLIVLMALDARPGETVLHRPVCPLPFAAAMGIFLFSLGGHPAFPTFQIDMKEPRRFGTACRTAFLYLLVAAGGYFVYGKKLKANILLTVSAGRALQGVQVLVTAHVLCSFVIMLNPVLQEMEELAGISPRFSVKRVLVRTGVCMGVLLIAETFPHFGAILSLIGGSTVTFLVFLCPPLFFFRLARAQGPWIPVQIPLVKTVILMEIMAVGVVMGVAATCAAVWDLSSPGTFVPPCFVDVTAAGR